MPSLRTRTPGTPPLVCGWQGDPREASTMQRGGPVPDGGQAENAAERVGRVSETAVLRARCRRQALAIDKLRDAVAVLRAGAGALKAENADLRSEHNRIRGVHEAASAVALRAPDPQR